MSKWKINKEFRIEEKQKQEQLAKEFVNGNKLLIDSICKNKKFSTRINTDRIISIFSDISFNKIHVKIIADSMEKFGEYNQVDNLIIAELFSIKTSINSATELTELIRSVSSSEVLFCLNNIVHTNASSRNFIHQLITIASLRGKELIDPMVKCYVLYSSNYSLTSNMIDWIWNAYNRDKLESNGTYIKEVLETFYQLRDVLKAAVSNTKKDNSLNFEISHSLNTTIKEGKFTRENINDISYFISNFDLIKRKLQEHYLIGNLEKYTVLTIVDLYKNIKEKKKNR